MSIKSRNEAQISNGAENLISQPFSVHLKIQGTQDILFHRWCDEAVQAKAEAKRGSVEKKTDDLESYVYRDDKGFIAIPGRYPIRAIVEAGRNFTEPRSSRKTAKDLVQAAVMCDELYSPILVNGQPVTDWDYEDRQRVCIMRSAITRTRPAFKKGWQVEFTLVSLVPEHITPDFLENLLIMQDC